ncbi:rhodanese [Terribacillus saccharophilus]|uniref:rhodanese-like domain-containing protein n=1 Tax=Terribacillus saccharophilus TaxID=361277 RepID=UPI000BA584CF|nr:rhodanese-like domain-containing protein [Terribacillus saccharophilus]PAF22105.1 rhodanese [Terribacillus saccharophilus]
MKEITAANLEQKLASGEKINIVDVREDAEIAEGKIPDAKHIALGQLPDRLNELDINEHYYMVCRSGGRSGKACEFLLLQGYNVTNMTGGMLAWEGEVE